MSLFKWRSAHSVYLPEIDAEHRALFRLGEELQKGIAAGTDLKLLRPILRELVTSGEAHFKHEERIMKAAHYNGLAWHKKQHDAVRWRIRRALRRIDAGHTDAVTEFLEFLDSWLKTHTAVSDRMMGAYLRNVLRFNTKLAS
ncbi:MAG TPA: hemerythrin family protein [Candidatus Acidoferrales bacterium]|nr:hemerythrin family protein [Candidatus Acidoferrales bacterium]